MEEEGDLNLLVFAIMEYERERESSKTEFNVVATLLKVGEGGFIVWGRTSRFSESQLAFRS